MSENQNKVNEANVKKAQELLSNQEFMNSLVSTETIEEAQKLFKANGLEVNEEEIKLLGKFINTVREKKGELSEDDVQEVVGGKNYVKKVVGGVAGAVGGFFVGEGIGFGIPFVTGAEVADAAKLLGVASGDTAKKIKGGAARAAGAGQLIGGIVGAIVGAKKGAKWGD